MENNITTITIKDTTDRKIELSFPSDGDVYSYLEEISHLLIAWGFHPDTIKDGICALSEQYEEIKDNTKEGE